jgi:flavodoxin
MPSITRRKTLSIITEICGMVLTKGLCASDNHQNAVTSATINTAFQDHLNGTNSNILLVLASYHHKNTEKVANAIAKILNAPIKTPQQISIEDFQKYSLIGFGSGIYDQMHHQSILTLVDNLPNRNINKNVFIYSTSGVSRRTCLKHSIDDPHTVLRNKLQSKDCRIIDEYNCTGWNTNSFLKLFGGINKGRPNIDDLTLAENFALNLQDKNRNYNQ